MSNRVTKNAGDAGNKSTDSQSDGAGDSGTDLLLGNKGQDDDQSDDDEDEDGLDDEDESGDDVDDVDGDESDDDEDEDDEDDNDGSPSAIAAAVANAIMPQIDAKIESTMDRRINAVLKEVRGGKPPKGSAGKSNTNQSGGSEVVDVRGARLAFREALSGEDFVSPEERKFANSLGRTLISAKAPAGITDEDEFGEQIANEVMAQVKSLRTLYVNQTKAALRRSGALAAPEKQGPKTNRTKGAAQVAGFATGAELASRRHGVKKD